MKTVSRQYQRAFGSMGLQQKTIVSPQCNDCLHLVCMPRTGSNGFCYAFPDGIPAEIITNRSDHKDPYPGDQGIRFESSELVVKKMN